MLNRIQHQRFYPTGRAELETLPFRNERCAQACLDWLLVRADVKRVVEVGRHGAAIPVTRDEPRRRVIHNSSTAKVIVRRIFGKHLHILHSSGGVDAQVQLGGSIMNSQRGRVPEASWPLPSLWSQGSAAGPQSRSVVRILISEDAQVRLAISINEHRRAREEHRDRLAVINCGDELAAVRGVLYLRGKRLEIT